MPASSVRDATAHNATERLRIDINFINTAPQCDVRSRCGVLALERNINQSDEQALWITVQIDPNRALARTISIVRKSMKSHGYEFIFFPLRLDLSGGHQRRASHLA
jgi:hypothetical protein